MGQVVSVVVAGAVGVQEWYFIGYASGCDGRNMLTRQTVRNFYFLQKKCRFLCSEECIFTSNLW